MQQDLLINADGVREIPLAIATPITRMKSARLKRRAKLRP
jgi:hypothetical protein